ncbi:MAG TPA: hypothetical protein VN688_00815 [Gemmataceae bacterium]|nr:hypothetical protein [Gemmataceae bacterium]
MIELIKDALNQAFQFANLLAQGVWLLRFVVSRPGIPASVPSRT